MVRAPRLIEPTPPHPLSFFMPASTNGFQRATGKENYRGESHHTTTWITIDHGFFYIKKDSGGWARRPSEKVKQAVHELKETVQRRNAKAQRDRERRRRHLLLEQGSEDDNEDDRDGQHAEEGDTEDEEEGEEGSHVGHPYAFRAPY